MLLKARRTLPVTRPPVDACRAPPDNHPRPSAHGLVTSGPPRGPRTKLNKCLRIEIVNVLFCHNEIKLEIQ